MKKILLAVALLLIVLIAAVYLLIPNRVHISQTLDIPVNRDGLMRNLADKRNWIKWWPEKNSNDSSTLMLNGRVYELLDAKVLSILFRIAAKGGSVPAEITIVGDGTDFSTVSIDGLMATSYNPFKRIQRYFTARKINKDAALLLKSMSDHYSGIPALYGYDIRKEHVVDSTLLTNIKEVTGYPTTEKIYSLVDELRVYIKSQGAAETGNPMLNILPKDSIHYILKVALPVNKKLPDSGTMSYRWMLGGGNILITEVKGGKAEINKAYRQIEVYISDFKRVAPAIPFESLVTDRRQQPDSNQWITRIYYPVM